MIVGPLAATIGIADTLWLAAGIVVVAATAVLAVSDVRRIRQLERPVLETSAPPEALAA
jgi:hypothetical protein